VAQCHGTCNRCTLTDQGVPGSERNPAGYRMAFMAPLSATSIPVEGASNDIYEKQVATIAASKATVTATAIQNFRFARFSASMLHHNGSRRHCTRVSAMRVFGSEGEGAGGSPSRFREPSATDHAAAKRMSGHG